MKDTLISILIWLSGKKGTIATILMGIVAYLAAIEVLGQPEVILATVIIGALFGTASRLTGKFVYNK